MAYKLTIELSDRDLRHFRRELRKARESVQIADDEEILGAAADLVTAMRRTELPDFVAERLEKLETLLAMVSDELWPLSEQERSPVLSGLAYLCDPEDLIPDDIPGIGMLDDAVMIELVFRELRHELEAYEDFLEFRKRLLLKAPGRQDAVRVEAKLQRRRQQLQERMRRRRKNQ
ncbi:MAG TPA: YkvA family protein [Steroidobacteraceae bacterium]|nr:YkvA family protein [Steroidobacteraceae bacterium]